MSHAHNHNHDKCQRSHVDSHHNHSRTQATIWRLATESVEGLALPLEGVDDIHGGDGLPASMLGVGDGVTDDVLKEDLEDTAGLLVDEARDALDATPACQTADGRLGDALDVVAKDLTVTLRAPLSQAFASLSTSGHC